MYSRDNTKDEFLNQLKVDREKRRVERLKNESIITIQALVRGFICRRKLKRIIRFEINELLEISDDDNDAEYKPTIRKANEIHNILRRYFTTHPGDKRIDSFIFKYLIRSLHSDDGEVNYLSLASRKDFLKLWLSQARILLRKCCEYIQILKPEIISDLRIISNCLHLIIIFTDSSKWRIHVDAIDAVKTSLLLFSRSFCMHLSTNRIHSQLKVLLTNGLARIKPCFSDASLTAIITIAFRCLDYGDQEENFMTLLCVPGLLHHVHCVSPSLEEVFAKRKSMSDLIVFLMNKEKKNHFFISLDGNDILCFIGNFIHLFTLSLQDSTFNIDDLKKVLILLFKSCSSDVGVDSNQSKQHWHLMMGWCNLNVNPGYRDSMPVIKKQLSKLWSSAVIDIMYKDLLNYDPVRVEQAPQVNKGLFSKLLKSSCPATPAILKMSSGLLAATCRSSQVYSVCADTLGQLKPDIVAGLTTKEKLLSSMWFMLGDLGNGDFGLKILLDAFHANNKSIFHLLSLVCDTSSQIITEIKMSEFTRELERNQKSKYILVLHYIPHVIPINQRLSLLRGYIQAEKSSISSNAKSTLITIRRTFVLEDGYRQLASLSNTALRGVIRVKFVNEQGLDEAGIDQDGVFKEFLEDSIKLAFNPSLNLFKTTEAHKLYPSSTSYLQDNHLNLFEFVGRILAKAIYEGIVVDVNFAKFFLTQMVGRFHYAIYSSIDELPSLDPDLYKNLTYIKGCTDEELSYLDLTFSIDENHLGKIVTHNLIPGGDMIEVTGDNKISYIHKMADFKMRTQIKSQRMAFLGGFRSVLQSYWLSMFSSDELQKLISGDSNDLDLMDLRRNTQYYGGFHDSHRVITWLWSILENDFEPEERGKFLKFVTSCSKGPLLGFANLEPSFSIRCVDTSEDQDTGDTIGSVLKGFFSIRSKQSPARLPTASTCFNLLKLPNYSKRALLRDKLRYSITNNCGFELS